MKFVLWTSSAPGQHLVDLLWCPSASQSLDSQSSSWSNRGEDQWRLLSRHAPVTAAVAHDA